MFTRYLRDARCCQRGSGACIGSVLHFVDALAQAGELAIGLLLQIAQALLMVSQLRRIAPLR